MELQSLIIGFTVLMLVVCGGSFFLIRRILGLHTEGALSRLTEEIEAAKKKQTELNRKLAEADDDLRRKRAEAQEIANRMRTEAEQEAKDQREKIVSKAREEGEDILSKAQASKERIKLDLEKENDMRVIRYSMDILNQILSTKAKGALNDVLISEFLDNFKNIDASRISPDIKEVDVVTVIPMAAGHKQQLTSVLKDKLNRELKINEKIDDSIGGGVIVRFGTMAVDGSIKNLIREAGTDLVSSVEQRVA